MSAENVECFLHNEQCELSGQWPDDPLVRYHRRVIDGVRRECDNHQLATILRSLLPS